jgi:hypothetical protein
MSLVADLLSKVSHKKIEGDIPPTLARTVFDSKKRGAQKRRLMIAGSFAVFLVVVGFVFVYYLNIFAGSSSSLLTQSAKANLETLKGAGGQNPRTPESPESRAVPPAFTKPESTIQSQPSAGSGGEHFSKKQPVHTDRPLSLAGVSKTAGPTTANGAESPNQAREIVARQKAERDELLYAARSHEAAREYDEALDFYKKALDGDRQNHIALNNVAGILIVKGAFKEAAGYARASLEINKAYVPSLINLGIASVRLSDMEEGKACLLKAVSLQPSNTQALMNLALLLEKQADYEEAKRYYSLLAAAKDVQGYAGIARVAEKTGRPEDARKAYRDILATDDLSNEMRKFATERLTVLEGG